MQSKGALIIGHTFTRLHIFCEDGLEERARRRASCPVYDRGKCQVPHDRYITVGYNMHRHVLLYCLYIQYTIGTNRELQILFMLLTSHKKEREKKNLSVYGPTSAE